VTPTLAASQIVKNNFDDFPVMIFHPKLAVFLLVATGLRADDEAMR
jgi:hypothetical protein